MRRVASGAAVVVAPLAAVYVGMRILFETSGEVIELRTLDAAGAPLDSWPWIVDVDGQQYPCTGDQNKIYINRLRYNPHVDVTRHGVAANYLATPLDDAAQRERVNAAVATKYAPAEKFLRVGILDPRRSIPIRLVPVPSEACDARGAVLNGGARGATH
jgi:hypothetical protein